MQLRHCTFQFYFICLALIIHHILCDVSWFQKVREEVTMLKYWIPVFLPCNILSDTCYHQKVYWFLLFVMLGGSLDYTIHKTMDMLFKILWNFLFIYCNIVASLSIAIFFSEVETNACYSKIFLNSNLLNPSIEMFVKHP